VAILRDVSASMEGDRAAWASAVVAQIVDLCKRRRLAVGYLEFNHEPLPVDAFSLGARGPPNCPALFTYDYGKVRQLASRTWSGGGTDLQRALRELIERYSRAAPPSQLGVASHYCPGHALLVTDGVTTSGEPMLEQERAAARAMGLCVHTVFIGPADEPYPPPLAALAAATGGLRFQARVETGASNCRLSWREGVLGWEAM
jgi:uncharacterized protein with von Willebrand factor type A (vWA) domain